MIGLSQISFFFLQNHVYETFVLLQVLFENYLEQNVGKIWIINNISIN